MEPTETFAYRDSSTEKGGNECKTLKATSTVDAEGYLLSFVKTQG